MAAGRASVHHRDLTQSRAFDRFTWSWVIRLSGLEQVKDVLRARRRPKREKLVLRVGAGPTATNRHKPGVPNLREDHGPALALLCPPHTTGRQGQAAFSTVASLEDQGGPSMSCGLAGTTAYPCVGRDCAFGRMVSRYVTLVRHEPALASTGVAMALAGVARGVWSQLVRARGRR